MGRNTFDAAHMCPEVGRQVNFVVLIGEPMKCPVCLENIAPKIEGEREIVPMFPNKER